MELVKEFAMIILIQEETQTWIQLEDTIVQTIQILVIIAKTKEIFLLTMLIR